MFHIELANFKFNQHSSKAWADENELAYFYTNNKVTHKGDKQTHGIKAIGKANLKKDQSDDLLQGFSVCTTQGH